ncbi:hypothetical protein MPL3365_250056 [Mesorhizobium plurifarium]|uniref:Uncharacterized protein n=1 Tax=Mesorhizobium plurifarium TaxID=69974 RepID=A0A090G564_MESPL|nr:hypothetical protein MPL3365_250056 [Mesorhizobium plurifarium]
MWGALSVVELGADELEPAPGDAIRAAIRRGNRFLAPQLPKKFKVEARIAPAVAGQAPDRGDLPALVLFDFDTPALREQVQDALFVARYVHWRIPGKNNKSRRRGASRHGVSGFSALPRLGGQGFTGTERKWTSTLHWNGRFLGESAAKRQHVALRLSRRALCTSEGRYPNSRKSQFS